MREISPESFKVYTLDELEPQARERAIEAMAEKLGGGWWDGADTEDVTDVMVYTLANEFGTPGHGNYGMGDFPGIDGVRLVAWDLERGSYLALRGTLTRKNAPSLPWADGLVEVTLAGGGDYTEVDVEVDEDDLDPRGELDLTVARERCRELAVTMEETVEAVMHAAMRDGRAEVEYKTGVVRAEEYIRSGEYEFMDDGTMFA